jgi:hypothetical protein
MKLPSREGRKIMMSRLSNFKGLLALFLAQGCCPSGDIEIEITEPGRSGLFDVSRLDNGVGSFPMAGFIKGASECKDLRVYLLVRPTNPPGAGWYCQPQAFIDAARGTWSGQGMIGNESYPPHDNDQFAIIAVVLDEKVDRSEFPVDDPMDIKPLAVSSQFHMKINGFSRNTDGGLRISRPREGDTVRSAFEMAGVMGQPLSPGSSLRVLGRDATNYFLMNPPPIITGDTWKQTNVLLASSGGWQLHVCLVDSAAKEWFDKRVAASDWSGFMTLPEGARTIASINVVRGMGLTAP